jgi:tetratricopeptide (TPR) repeat protein
MDTLYELLGALPRDDAEELRGAFRRAVKGSHPDLHPGDPDAGFKFRQIVRANEILADPDQRATYDHLLDLAEDEKKQLGKHAVMHRVVAVTSFAVALGFISAASVGGYLLFQQMSDALSAPIGQVASVVSDVAASMREPFETAAAPVDAPARPIPVATISIQMTPPKTEIAKIEIAKTEITKTAVALNDKAESIDVPRADIVPASITVPAEPTPVAAPPLGPPLEIAPPPEAKAFRERGISAYRSGELDSAIADFDRAIQLDPKFTAAYIDRGIVLYRLRKFEKAFADIAQAKSIERTRTAKTGKKQRTTNPAIEMSVMPPPLPKARHTARLDSPREVGFLASRRREMP